MIFEDNLYLLATLGLSGGWCYLQEGKKKYEFTEVEDDFSGYIPDADLETYLKNAKSHLNVEFKTEKGSLYFYDTLSFGTLKVLKTEVELNKKLKTIGPDIMDETTTLDLFKTQIKKTVNQTKEIGVVLMNQKIIAGIGNYLRADILWMSRISPFRLVGRLSDKELRKIYKNTRILTWGEYDRKKIAKSNKLPINYGRDFFVYREDKDIYGNPVKKEELYEGSQKRFIYWVKNRQI
jgi:formamidopyrimidine-DNA glycosylase